MSIRSRGEPWADPFALFTRLKNRLFSLWLARTYPFAYFGKGVWIHSSFTLRRHLARNISIGDRVSIDRNCWINIPELPNHERPIVVIEEACKLGRGCIISAKNVVHIGPNAILDPSVFITDHNHQFEDVTIPIGDQGTTPGGKIRIEEGCRIGFGAAIVCSGAEIVIGRNSVIGANSLVTRSMGPCSIAVGNPARIVKRLNVQSESGTIAPHTRFRS
jgi:acetyltransferase-like isoleucine patch superfamily enzyme